MDKQFAFAVIIILLGFGLTQLKQDSDPFSSGLGVGTIAIGVIWIVFRIIKDLKKKK